MVSKPDFYPNWTDGDPTKVTKPPSSLLLSGWTPGEPPPADYLNWLFWEAGRWIEYLDQIVNADVSIFQSTPLMRLINGGKWSFNLSTGALAWSSAFNLATPSIADADNQAASGSVTLTDGQVAYVSANIPFTTTGGTASGSPVITGITQAQGISVGQTVTGTNIPGSTTVISGPTDQGDGTFHVTLSANATGTGSVSLTFSGIAALTVSAAAGSALVPGPTTVIIARRVGSVVIVGVNSGQAVLRDKESKELLAGGYLSVFSATAGENLTQGEAVYLSSGAGDGGRTAGAAYKVDAGASNGGTRSGFIGFVVTSASSTASVTIVSAGLAALFTSLVLGSLYYADPAVPGAVTSTKPTTSGQWVVPVGMSVSSTTLVMNDSLASTASVVSSNQAYPNYFVTNETDLGNAITSASGNGGGVILVMNSFTVSSSHVVPVGTKVIGRKGGSIITFASSGALTFSDDCEVDGVWFTTALTSGTLMTFSGNRCSVYNTKNTVPATSTTVCMNVTGNENFFSRNTFAGVAGDSTGVGIQFSSGVDNTETDNNFLT